MALESTPNQAFLGGGDDDLAALDSMAFTGTQSQFGAPSAAPGAGAVGGAPPGALPTGRVGDGREGGFAGVSESLFDRIRARTAEQQRQSMAAQSSAPPQPVPQQVQQPSVQAPAQSSQQSAFALPPQQPSGGSTMEYEKDLLGMGADGGANPADAGNVAPADHAKISNAAANNNNGNSDTNETTYSFSASGGEDFSQAAPMGGAPLQVPQYGRGGRDPYQAAYSDQQRNPANLQVGAVLAQTGEAVKSLFGTIGGMAQEKLGGGGRGAGGAGAGGAGGRSYNNNFLLGDDGIEEGGGGNLNNPAAMGQPPSQPAAQPPPPVAMAAAPGEAGTAGASSQAYSMFAYGRTFCEDLIGFARQLPLWGKGFAVLVLLWALYVLFG